MLKNKIVKLLVGTNNKGKLREIKDLLPKTLEIYSPQDLKIKSPPENGKTFKENSLIKAKFFSKKSKMTCLSDDSGLEIDVLDGDPGIYSCLLYTSDAADDSLRVDLGGRRIIKKVV